MALQMELNNFGGETGSGPGVIAFKITRMFKETGVTPIIKVVRSDGTTNARYLQLLITTRNALDKAQSM